MTPRLLSQEIREQRKQTTHSLAVTHTVFRSSGYFFCFVHLVLPSLSFAPIVRYRSRPIVSSKSTTSGQYVWLLSPLAHSTSRMTHPVLHSVSNCIIPRCFPPWSVSARTLSLGPISRCQSRQLEKKKKRRRKKRPSDGRRETGHHIRGNIQGHTAIQSRPVGNSVTSVVHCHCSPFCHRVTTHSLRQK